MANASGNLEGWSFLVSALRANVPLVALLGQNAGWARGQTDPILKLALARANREGETWKALLARDPLPSGYYEWLSERFVNRAPSQDILSIADAPLSAVYTSSVDPTFANLFATLGREPEPVLLGDPPPPVARSRRRPPIYYLFGRAGAGSTEFLPPISTQALSQRRLRHASAMLRTLNETATALGLIIIDGYNPESDWLRPEELIAVIGLAPRGGVLWCGDEPQFGDSDEGEIYASLVAQGVIVRHAKSLGLLLSELRAAGEVITVENWNEPETITLADGSKIVTTPQLRLTTQASASIIDDSWTDFLQPLVDGAEYSAFVTFHGSTTGPRGLIEGVRRGYSFRRDFEAILEKRVDRAISHHHEERGAIVLHGQSGVGKTMALGRLALAVRSAKSAAVLFSFGRVPQATDVADFLEAVDKAGAVTLLIVDATVAPARYDDLLQSLRSRGHRVVVVGTSYRIDPATDSSRLILASDELSEGESNSLVELVRKFTGNDSGVRKVLSQPHALARFFWEIPSSRPRLSDGLGREARAVEAGLRDRGARVKPIRQLGDLGEALVKAGYSASAPLLQEDAVSSIAEGTAAGRIIDYVMAASRIYKWVPVNLLLRSVINSGLMVASADTLEVVRELFEGQDIFRWRFSDEQSEELLVGARLQIEAELVCNRRLGGARAEALRLLELVKSAVRASSEENEETRFVADLVYALGPDGPFGERYRESYADIARSLTYLRERHGVMNARLMLQEATLRRHHVRTHQLDVPTKAALLDEARSAIEKALEALDRSTGRRLTASRRTRDNLWVERAATYGYLATDSAHRVDKANDLWLAYRAAREAVRMAVGRVDTYYPLDIGLWLPADILRSAKYLDPSKRLELEADIRATLDQVDPEALESNQYVVFQRQRLRVGEVLSDEMISEDAFAALASTGSCAGYFLRAKAIAPIRTEAGEVVSQTDRAKAEQAAKYLWSVYSKISADDRCLLLLLSCEWTASTGRWLFRGQRQPLPSQQEIRSKIQGILLDLVAPAPTQVQTRFRYLKAVLDWLVSDEQGGRAQFRELARETEYFDRGRVINRHVIADESGNPKIYQGVIERQAGDNRWAVYVPELSRHVDLVDSKTGNEDFFVGKSLKGFSVAFNYLGPIVDMYVARQRNQ